MFGNGLVAQSLLKFGARAGSSGAPALDRLGRSHSRDEEQCAKRKGARLDST